MAGYSKTPLWKKIGYKDGFRCQLFGEQDNYLEMVDPLPESVILEDLDLETTELDLIHFFTKQRTELETNFPRLKSKINKTGIIWISWPKKASKVQTDIVDSVVRSIGLDTGLVDVKVAAIDHVWSGLKFVYRTKDR